MAATTIRVATERITPSKVRKERSLWARRVSSAINIGSRQDKVLRALLGTAIQNTVKIVPEVGERFKGYGWESLMTIVLVFAGRLEFDDSKGLRENRTTNLSGPVAQFGSALPWHGRGRRFDPDQVHHLFNNLQ